MQFILKVEKAIRLRHCQCCGRIIPKNEKCLVVKFSSNAKGSICVTCITLFEKLLRLKG